MLQIGGMDEAKVALLIAHELSHFLLDHQVSRLSSMLGTYIVNKYKLKLGSYKDLDPYDPVTEEFKNKKTMQKYSCFYPSQR
mgnify:CR=1 FL=1